MNKQVPASVAQSFELQANRTIQKNRMVQTIERRIKLMQKLTKP